MGDVGGVGVTITTAENLKSQARDKKSDLKMLQPYVSTIVITPPARLDALTQAGAGESVVNVSV